MSSRRLEPKALNTFQQSHLSVVVGYSFDDARQHFPGVRLRAHADRRISRLSEKFGSDFRLKPVGGFFAFLEQHLWPPVTKLPQTTNIHENTLFFSTDV